MTITRSWPPAEAPAGERVARDAERMRGSSGDLRNGFQALLLALGVLLAATGVGNAQTAQQAPKQATKQPAKKPAAPPPTETWPALEPKAIDILKAACGRLAAARTMAFTAVVAYESPSRLGPPLVYTTKSEVMLQRPDKLRVITLGDGPASEFYYDGKIMMAYAPAENLVAVADAPPTIDAALQAAYNSADIYFPFDDVIVADPYKDLAEGMSALSTSANPRCSAERRRTWWRTSPKACSCRPGSAPRTTAPHAPCGLPGRSIATAPWVRAYQLAAEPSRSGGRLWVIEGRQRHAYQVRPAGIEAPAGGQASDEG